MKKVLLVVAAFLVGNATFAQQADWKQMEAFHSVMSKSFHPAEEGNLKPVKENANALVAKAKEWQASAVPAGYKAEVAKPILKQLVADCTALEGAVKSKKTDKELAAMITKAHDTFHEIKEKCKVGGEGHEKH
ncbi:MAG: hypothetical protein EAZ62_03770 [Sphingobacteriia bacterium]|nr:MAG: hypothetical protein EAZ62_03770 [Sphingobacteriia bacterium]